MFNLIHDIDLEKTQSKIDKFKQENKELIAANLSKQMNEEKLMAYKLEKERKERHLRKEAYLMHLQEEEKAKKAHQQSIISKLVFS